MIMKTQYKLTNREKKVIDRFPDKTINAVVLHDRIYSELFRTGLIDVNTYKAIDSIIKSMVDISDV